MQGTGHTVEKMEEEEDYWYYTLIELSLSRGDPPHASLTYVLTATTSPMMHFCGGEKIKTD